MGHGREKYAGSEVVYSPSSSGRNVAIVPHTMKNASPTEPRRLSFSRNILIAGAIAINTLVEINTSNIIRSERKVLAVFNNVNHTAVIIATHQKPSRRLTGVLKYAPKSLCRSYESPYSVDYQWRFIKIGT